MLDRPDTAGERSPEELLECINHALKDMGSTMRYKKIPDAFPGCESLKGKHITMVDDSNRVLEGFLAELMVATGGCAQFIYQQGQTVDELVNEVLATNSDVILMDYMLQEYHGDTVVRRIREKNPSLLCIGFSSMAGAFNHTGIPSVRKNAWDREKVFQEIAEIMRLTPQSQSSPSYPHVPDHKG